MARKGIYCLEGLWDQNNVKDKSTVLPILDLLYKRGYCNYIYHDCATKAELEYFLKKWRTKAISGRFPILYLAFHGKEETICLNDDVEYSLEELSALLEGRCEGKVIHFGSCLTLNTHGNKIQNFLHKTGAIATIGYRGDIEWMRSTACDLLIFEAMQHDKLDSIGIKKIKNKIFKDYGNLYQILDLRMEINGKRHFPRKRVVRGVLLKKKK